MSCGQQCRAHLTGPNHPRARSFAQVSGAARAVCTSPHRGSASDSSDGGHAEAEVHHQPRPEGPPRTRAILHHPDHHGVARRQHAAHFFWQVAAALHPLAPGADGRSHGLSRRTARDGMQLPAAVWVVLAQERSPSRLSARPHPVRQHGNAPRIGCPRCPVRAGALWARSAVGRRSTGVRRTHTPSARLVISWLRSPF